MSNTGRIFADAVLLPAILMFLISDGNLLAQNPLTLHHAKNCKVCGIFLRPESS
jgi:hypothetical protein